MFTTFSKPGLVDLETNPMFPRCSKPRFRDLGTVVMFTTFIKPGFLELRANIYFLEVLKTRISGLWTRSNVYDLIETQRLLCFFKSNDRKILEAWICRFGNRSNANEIIFRDVGTNVMFGDT